MKYIALLLVFFSFLITFIPTSSAQVNIEAFIRKRTEEFMNARQTRKGEVMRKYYDIEKVKEVHEYIKAQYITVRDDLKKGVFTEKYVRRSIEDSTFGDSYKEALLRCVFKNGDFDKELDLALTNYLGTYEYKITKFTIERVVVLPDNKSVKVQVIEDRLGAGQKQAQQVSRIYKWDLKNNVWLLSMENTPNL
ncbi:MAG: hypothetical protein HY819_09080 [Acidobacteria bacterium]|nr:hypothetical protein [Acidobacteriota bacterium]